MIRVRKIAHVSYELPDVAPQVEYYTDVLGLTAVGQDKDATFLASTVDHHAVVLRQGDKAQCTRVGFQIGPDDDLNDFERQVQGHGIKTRRLKDPEPSISDMVAFEDPCILRGRPLQECLRGERLVLADDEGLGDLAGLV